MIKMTEEVFKALKPGDRVAYRGMVVTVDRWLEPDYMVQYTNGQNTKLSDPWLKDMRVIKGAK